MNIKKNDNIIVIAGKDRGKTGKVLKTFPKLDRVVVEGINVMKRHQKARKQGTKGQTLEIAMPFHVSNIMIVDPKSGKRSRIGKKLVKERYIRIAKKSGSEL